MVSVLKDKVVVCLNVKSMMDALPCKINQVQNIPYVAFTIDDTEFEIRRIGTWENIGMPLVTSPIYEIKVIKTNLVDNADSYSTEIYCQKFYNKEVIEFKIERGA